MKSDGNIVEIRCLFMNQIQLNERVFNRRMALSGRSVGVALFCLYVFISSLANDMVLSSSIGSLTLYLFLGYSVLYILLNKKLKIVLMDRGYTRDYIIKRTNIKKQSDKM